MKTSIFVTAVFAAATAFAADNAQTTPTTAPKTDKGWTNFVGAGVTVPVSKYNIDDTDYFMVSGGVNLNYMGVGKSGFAVKASWSAGAGFTSDVKFDPDDDNTAGTYTAAEVGVGYAFVNTPDWTVAASINSNEYENDDFSRTDNIKSSESDGGFTVVPTVGAMWSF